MTSLRTSAAVNDARAVQVVAVSGGKGGVGKTNVSVNLSVALCMLGRRVALLDADLGLANVDVLLGLNPERNLADVMEGRCSLAEVLVEGPHGLMIVPAASGSQEMVHLGALEHAGLIAGFTEIADHVDVLVVDSAGGIGRTVTGFLAASREIVLVVCDEPTSVAGAYALLDVLARRHGVERVRVLANMTRSDGDGAAVHAKLEHVAGRFLDVQLVYAGSIGYDDYVRRAVQKQRAVVDAYPASRVSGDFMRLAEAVDGWPTPAFARGHVEFFVEQLIGRGIPRG